VFTRGSGWCGWQARAGLDLAGTAGVPGRCAGGPGSPAGTGPAGLRALRDRGGPAGPGPGVGTGSTLKGSVPPYLTRLFCQNRKNRQQGDAYIVQGRRADHALRLDASAGHWIMPRARSRALQALRSRRPCRDRLDGGCWASLAQLALLGQQGIQGVPGVPGRRWQRWQPRHGLSFCGHRPALAQIGGAPIPLVICISTPFMERCTSLVLAPSVCRVRDLTLDGSSYSGLAITAA